MSADILKLLNRANMSALELRQALNCRHEDVYAALAQMEAIGLVTVWTRRAPHVSLWCRR